MTEEEAALAKIITAELQDAMRPFTGLQVSPGTVAEIKKSIKQSLDTIVAADSAEHIQIVDGTTPIDREARRVSIQFVGTTPFGKALVEYLRTLSEPET